MQFADVADLAMLHPVVAAVLVDQRALDSGCPRADHVDRVDVTRKPRLLRPHPEPLERDMEDPRVRLCHPDHVRIDDGIEVRGKPETPRVVLDLALRVRDDRKLVALRLEPLERLESSRPDDPPQGRGAMDFLEARAHLGNLLVRNSRRPHPSEEEFPVAVVYIGPPRSHQESIQRSTPLVLRILQRERIEPPPWAAELARQKLVVEKRERSAKVEKKSFDFTRFQIVVSPIRSHRLSA